MSTAQQAETRFRFDVASAALGGPEGELQTYLDRRSLRAVLATLGLAQPIGTALDVGCGYGRLTMVLAEFARQVVAIEREPALAQWVRRLLPAVRLLEQDVAAPFPLEDDGCEFIMTFLVLQHLPDDDCRLALQEIQRVTAPGGTVLLVEKTTPGTDSSNATDRRLFISRHRRVTEYAGLMAPFTLMGAWPRPVEPLYRYNPGSFMLFRRPRDPSTPASAGFCVWLTGLPASGKSTVARHLAALLAASGYRPTLLDGDLLRQTLSVDLGFSQSDRDTHVRRVGALAAALVRDSQSVLCALISPYRAIREECRRLIGADRFVEVFVDAPLAVCEARDPKGLYARARRGEIAQFTGISDSYEPPVAPALTLDTVNATAEQNAQRIYDYLVGRRLVKSV